VLTDEIYEHLVYGDNQFVSMPTVVPELADQCIIVNGVAKTYSMTGWRVGWMIGPSDVMKAATNFQSHSTSNVSNVAQIAALEAVSGDLSAVAMMREAFSRRAITMHRMINEIPGVNVPQETFYCYPNFVAARSPAGLTARSAPPRSNWRRDLGRQRWLRARRGVRHPRLRPLQLRDGRRRHGRRHPPYPAVGQCLT
jgi:aspartate/methionine/tyrosine aminotransferase